MPLQVTLYLIVALSWALGLITGLLAYRIRH